MRIVALSDLHGHLPEIPACDVVIVAGDVCRDFFVPQFGGFLHDAQMQWFNTHIRTWLNASPATHKILTWGNHDWCGQICDFSADAPDRAPDGCMQVVVDRMLNVPAAQRRDADTASPLRVWASPWSNQFCDWAFMAPPGRLAGIYAAIPEGIDVLVSHQPPYGYGDWTDRRRRNTEHLGSRELLATIERVRPRLVICGHIHGGYGAYEHDGIPIYNVNVVNEAYELVHRPTVIECG